METINAILALLAGFGIRILVPAGVTALAVYLLRRLDARWQVEAVTKSLRVIKPECWKTKGCSEEKRAVCPGYNSPAPCWQIFRQKNGYLKQTCLGCEVLGGAPVPIHN